MSFLSSKMITAMVIEAASKLNRHSLERGFVHAERPGCACYYNRCGDISKIIIDGVTCWLARGAKRRVKGLA